MVAEFPLDVLHCAFRAAKVFNATSREEYFPPVERHVFTSFEGDLDLVEDVAAWRETQFFAVYIW